MDVCGTTRCPSGESTQRGVGSPARASFPSVHGPRSLPESDMTRTNDPPLRTVQKWYSRH